MENVEEQAREHGWLPEEEFKAIETNEGKKWRSAEDFMDRKSLFDKIDDQHKELRNLRQGQQATAEYIRNIEESTRKKVLKELEAKKAEAIKEGDVAKVEEIRDQIDEAKQAPEFKPPQPSGPPPEMVQWMNENSWYNTDNDMRDFADSYGVTLYKKGTMTPQEILREVSKKTRLTFPEKFRNPNKDSAPPVTTGKKTGAQGDTFVMTDQEEQIMKRMIRAGVPSVKNPKERMTAEEYKEQLKATRGA